MINQDSQLKLQAFLDGEMPSREAAEVRDWVARDREASALLDEMRGVDAVMAGHEAHCKLPESREFFWSKIEREIERQERTVPVRPASWFSWLRQHFVSVSGAGLVACLCGLMAIHLGGAPSQLGEMELASDDMGSYTFRDQQEKVTMVWLYDRDDSAQATASKASDTDAIMNSEPE
jgi:hypothetical protein